MLCLKRRSEQTNLRDSLDSQTNSSLNVDLDSLYHFWRSIRAWDSENHQIKSKSSRKLHIIYLSSDRIRNFVVESKIRFLIINTRNILFTRESFENSIYFLSKSIVLFYSLDELDISLEVRFWIIISVKSLLITSTLKSFFLLESQFENISIDHNKSIFFFCLNDNFNKSSQKVIQHFSKIFRSILLLLFNIVSHISIWIIACSWESSKITSVCLANWLEFSTFVMKSITLRIQISNQFFRFIISSFNTSTRIQYWNHFSASRTSRNHIDFICKESRFSRLRIELNNISSETTRIF